MKRPEGFKGFSIMSVGQVISLIGSSMTQFGIGIWIWQTTGNATPFSIVASLFFMAKKESVNTSGFGGRDNNNINFNSIENQ